MHIYIVVNVETMKHYEPSMLDREMEEQVLPIIEYLAPKSQGHLVEDIVYRRIPKLLEKGNMTYRKSG
jgi:hypothetical protein